MKIGVIGAGVIGLTTGIRLIEAGHSVTIVARDIDSGTTSHRAGAVWFPFHVEPPEKAEIWGKETIEIYKAEAARNTPGIKFIDFRVYTDVDGSEPYWLYLAGGGRALSQPEICPTAKFGWATRTCRIDASIYMPYLKERFLKLGGKIHQASLKSISDLGSEFKLVVNCAGVWANELSKDAEVYPIRGQIIAIERTNDFPDISHSMETVSAVTYIISREKEVILGGTAQDGDWNLTPDPKTAEGILERCSWLNPAVLKTRIIEHRVGLRPGRKSVRLGLESEAKTPLIHNYGHGGGGFTLAWGCAMDVVKMARSVT